MKKTAEEDAPKRIRSAAELASNLRRDKRISSIARFRTSDEFESVAVIPTGIATLDGIIGRGGVPRGRITVYSGKEGSGKTSAALATAAAFQRRGGIVMYCDVERKLDPDWAAINGVNIDDLILTRPKHLEAMFEVAEAAILRADPSVPFLFVLDSINAGITKEQQESKWGTKFYAAQPRAFSECLPKIEEALEQSNATFLFISQIRAKMDATTTIAGGNAVRFYSLLIITFDNVVKITSSGQKLWKIRKEYKDQGRQPPPELVTPIGIDCKIQTIKNQLAPPFLESTMRINFKKGVDRRWCLLHRAEEVGVIEVDGGWKKFQDVKWQNEKALSNAIKKRPKLLDEIRKAIRKV